MNFAFFWIPHQIILFLSHIKHYHSCLKKILQRVWNISPYYHLISRRKLQLYPQSNITTKYCLCFVDYNTGEVLKDFTNWTFLGRCLWIANTNIVIILLRFRSSIALGLYILWSRSSEYRTHHLLYNWSELLLLLYKNLISPLFLSLVLPFLHIQTKTQKFGLFIHVAFTIYKQNGNKKPKNKNKKEPSNKRANWWQP